MSRFTKKKFVVDEVLNKYVLPTENQAIVKILKSCGNNLHEVITANGEQFLVSMPSKFRKHIWIKRGDFVVIDPIIEGDKVKGEIVQILLRRQIKYFKEEGIWPARFSVENSNVVKEMDYSDVGSFENVNRCCIQIPSSSSSSSCSDDDEEDEND